MGLVNVATIFFGWLLVFILLPWSLSIKFLPKQSRLTNSVLSAGAYTLIWVVLDAAEQWVDNHFGKPTFILLLFGIITACFLASLLYGGNKIIKKYAVGRPTINIKRLGKSVKFKHYFAPKKD